MKGRLIVDVGSRLGSVLYAVHAYGKGQVNAVGIEMNGDFCKLQRKVIEMNGMDANVKVVNDDVRKQSELISAADVVILNNVFSFFLPPSDQAECWEVLHNSVRHGAVIISNPALEHVTEHLALSFNVTDWLDKIETSHLAARFAGTNEELFDDCSKLTLYSVKHSSTSSTQ